MKRKFLTFVLAFTLVGAFFLTNLNLSPTVQVNAEEENVEATIIEVDNLEDAVPRLGDEHRIFSLDVGRRYFSVDQIKTVLDVMNQHGYSDLQLLVGNDGLRFQLDDMALEVNGTVYSSEEVRTAITEGTNQYFEDPTGNHLTQSDMDEILRYAHERNINIIPGINGPGHMNAILNAMDLLGIQEARYNLDGEYSQTTINVTNEEARAFNKALVNQYLDYFKGRVDHFNLGLDEFANDIGGGPRWDSIQASGEYTDFINYTNDLAELVSSKGMRPMGYNDGIYYNERTDFGTFHEDLLISYWIGGWWGFDVASAQFIEDQGLEMINSNDGFYYVIGHEEEGLYNFQDGYGHLETRGFRDVSGSDVEIQSQVGTMAHAWADDPSKVLVFDNVLEHIRRVANQFNEYFSEDLRNTRAVVPETHPSDNAPGQNKGDDHPSNNVPGQNKGETHPSENAPGQNKGPNHPANNAPGKK